MHQEPPCPSLRFVFGGEVLLLPEQDHGMTPRGRRLHVPITGGRLLGPRLQATVLPGGADWQIERADGVYELDARYDLRTDDGCLIHVRNQALWQSPTGDWPASYAVCQPRFEAPLGPHSWLNDRLFVGTIAQGGSAGASIRLAVFEVQMPDLQMPDLQMPDLRMHDMQMPDVQMPGMAMPDGQKPAQEKPNNRSAA